MLLCATTAMSTGKPSTRKEAGRGLLSVVLGAEIRKRPERRSMPGTRQLLRFAAGSKKCLAHGNVPMGLTKAVRSDERGGSRKSAMRGFVEVLSYKRQLAGLNLARITALSGA